MTTTTNEIKSVQDSLRHNYSIEEYNRIVSELKSRANSDPEMLGYIADDRMTSPDTRLFALAAMGELWP